MIMVALKCLSLLLITTKSKDSGRSNGHDDAQDPDNIPHVIRFVQVIFNNDLYGNK